MKTKYFLYDVQGYMFYRFNWQIIITFDIVCPGECKRCTDGSIPNPGSIVVPYDGGVALDERGICLAYCTYGISYYQPNNGVCGNGTDFRKGTNCKGCDDSSGD